MTTEHEKMGSAAAHLGDALMEAAWSGFIQWAIKQADVRARFRDATGENIDQPRTAIERMVDDVTGRTDDVTAKFVRWATVEIWGLEYSPRAYQEHVAAELAGDQ